MAIPVHLISPTHLLSLRFRFTIYLKHAPSCGDFGSSYISNAHPHSLPPAQLNFATEENPRKDVNSEQKSQTTTDTHRKVRVHVLAGPLTPSSSIRKGQSTIPNDTIRSLIWRFWFIVFLKHAPSFGDSGLSCSLNTLPHLAIPVHHISLTRPRISVIPVHPIS